MTRWHKHHDLLHPDTINVLVESIIGDSESPLLVQWIPEAKEWIAILPLGDEETYCNAPILRRFQRDGSGWRHFPMDVPPDDPVYDFERSGVPFDSFVVEECGTWSVRSAVAAGFAMNVGQRLTRCCEVARVLGCLPGAEALAIPALDLQLAFEIRHSRSCQLDAALCRFAHCMLATGTSTCVVEVLRLSDVERFPSAQRLDTILKAIEHVFESPLRISGVAPTQESVNRLSQLFDLDQSVFLGGADGRPLGSPIEWKGRERIRMKLRNLALG